MPIRIMVNTSAQTIVLDEARKEWIAMTDFILRGAPSPQSEVGAFPASPLTLDGRTAYFVGNHSDRNGNHMKTTVEISDALLDEAKKLAAREGTSVRNLIEQGLRHVVSDSKPRRAFRLRKASFKGRGLSAEARRLDWPHLRELAYEGRGG